MLLCIDAIAPVWLDPGLLQKSHLVVVQSLFAFMIALITAGNFLSFREQDVT
jgi:hypothetical protein